MVHEAAVTEPHSQRHGILSVRAVSLGNQVNDTHRVIHNACLHLLICSMLLQFVTLKTVQFNQHRLISMCLRTSERERLGHYWVTCPSVSVKTVENVKTAFKPYL